ncbi:MAG: hypothetical protein ACRDQ5_20195 [Sciscionella sp.]
MGSVAQCSAIIALPFPGPCESNVDVGLVGGIVGLFGEGEGLP